MNPNDILAQQQAMLNQMAQNQQHWVVVMLVLGIVSPLISAWVIYMFYRCQRDAADELMQIRIILQMSEGRKDEAVRRTPPPAGDDSRHAPNPFKST
jgi:hypothetical protein